MLDRYGDIEALELGQQGLYHADTSFLFRFVLRPGRSRPLLLSSTVKDDDALLTVDLSRLERFQRTVFHADGTPADGSIALCEVQGYVYAAKRHAAEVAAILCLSAAPSLPGAISARPSSDG